MIGALLGDYTTPAPPGLLIRKRQDEHPTSIAALLGARFVPCFESGENRKLNEELVKWLTGGDRLTARRMRQDFFTFSPTHKLWLASNHKPVVPGGTRPSQTLTGPDRSGCA